MTVACCAPVFGQEREARSPEEADRVYHEVGEQLFCICGCREGLLVCSHNVCSAKEQEREYLRELSGRAELDNSAIKAEMVKRFGKGVLQVPEESSLYPILVVVTVLLVGAFGVGFWVVSHKEGDDEDEQPDAPDDPELEARIEKELKELD
jgi:cytochrome c-type biogenesis protein CcmH/NrfF